MTRTIGDRQDNQGRQLKRWASASTANGTPQWLRAALYHVRDHHEALLRPLKVLTREPQRVREATPEEERVLVRHRRDDYRPMFLHGVVSGMHETRPCTLQCADRLEESADRISDQTTSRRPQPRWEPNR
jgi:hypothetical protein